MTGLVILLVLLLLFISARFVKYIQLAVEGAISSAAVFKLLALQIPAVTGFLLPMAFFIGILLTLGRLYADHELVVICGLGLSEYGLAKMILPVAIGLGLVSALLSFGVNPWANLTAKNLVANESAQAKLGVFSPGRFQENGSATGVVFVESREGEQIRKLFAVSRSGDDSAGVEIQTARQGRQWQDEATGQDYLVLENGEIRAFDGRQNRWQQTTYAQYFMRISNLKPEEAELKVSSLSSPRLLALGGKEHWSELHWRLSAPVSIIILCFLAVPLARTPPRKGRFSKLFAAIMVYMVYAMLLLNSRRLIETGQIPAPLGMWWIHLLAIALAYWLYQSNRPKIKRRAQADESRV